MIRQLLQRVLLFCCALGAAGCVTFSQPRLSYPGISVVQKIVLGGMEQTIFIRGRDRRNPILLVLHGGPGLPEMPFSHVNAELERDYTVVNWDQRGAGKSFRPGIPIETMTIPQMTRDAEELTRYLRRTFGQKKIYLVGYSWGSLLGVLAVKERPEYYRAYIGISQLVSVPKSELLLHRAGVELANQRGKRKVAQTLSRIGEPPYRNRHDERLVNRLTKELQPHVDRKVNRARSVLLGLQSRYYSIRDLSNIIRGVSFSGIHLEREILSRDLEVEVPELNVPVWFFLGRFDSILSAPLAERYFNELRAPQGKHLIWFEHSDHILHLEEDVRYREELRRVLALTQDS